MDLINILFAKALNNGDATKEYVNEAIKALKGEVSADLDTLEELSRALGNDPDFFLTVKNEFDSFKTELVTNKDAATENTRFAIGIAEQTLEVPSMEEFNQLKDEKLSEPAEGLAVGKYFRVAAIDENGHAVLEAVDAKDVGVQDVQVAGASVVADGVANVPIMSETIAGVAKINKDYGLNIKENKLSIYPAAELFIDKRSGYYRPIVPSSIDYAVKAAMCDGKGAAWTADEQAAARERMGIPGNYELLEESIFEETVTYMSRKSDGQGNAYCLDAIMIYLETEHDDSNGTGRCAVYTDNGYVCDFHLGNLNNTQGSISTVKVYPLNGCWNSSARNAVNNLQSTTGYANIMNGYIKPYIKSGYIRNFNISGKIVAGSKLMVYGVRA